MGDTLINTTKGLDRLEALSTLIMDNCDLALKEINNNSNNSYGYKNINNNDDNTGNVAIVDNHNNFQYNNASYSQLHLASNIKNLNLSTYLSYAHFNRQQQTPLNELDTITPQAVATNPAD